MFSISDIHNIVQQFSNFNVKVILVLCISCSIFSCKNKEAKQVDVKIVQNEKPQITKPKLLINTDSIRIDSLKRLWQAPSSVFPQTKFSYIVASFYNPKYDAPYIDSNEKIKADFSLKLNAKQANTILAIINDTATYRQGMSGCFYPHHQLDFYNNQNKIVAEYSICFQCNQISASKKSPRMLDGMLSDNGALNFESYFKRIGLPLESK